MDDSTDVPPLFPNILEPKTLKPFERVTWLNRGNELNALSAIILNGKM